MDDGRDMAQLTPLSNYHPSDLRMLLLLVVSGLTLSSLAFFFVDQRDQAEAWNTRAKHVHDLVLGLQRNIDQHVDIVSNIAGLYAVSQTITRKQVQRYTKTILHKYPTILALEWIPRVPAAQRDRYEKQLQQLTRADPAIWETDSTGTRIRARSGDEYFPVFFVEPLQSNIDIMGYNLISNPSRRSALNRARDLALPTATAPIRLVHNSEEQPGFLIIAPIFTIDKSITTITQRRQYLRGYVLGVYRIHDLLDQLFLNYDTNEFSIRVSDYEAGVDPIHLYSHDPADIAGDTNARQPQTINKKQDIRHELKVADRHWTFDFYPTNQKIRQRWEKWALAITGICLTLLTARYILTSRRRSEVERIVNERTADLRASNKELESYSYSIAHDLRTPLRAITSFSQILDVELKDRLTPGEKDSLKRIIAAGKHMAALIDDILVLSRISRQSIKKRNIDLSTIADNIAENLRLTDPQRQVSWEITPDMTVYGDQQLLTIAMLNLLSNAWKYSAKNTAAVIRVGTKWNEGKRVFFVADDGIGFDMQYSDDIFKPFRRLHKDEWFEGTGIGLATVARIIGRHHGEIWVEAQPGQGATFFFTLA